MLISSFRLNKTVESGATTFGGYKSHELAQSFFSRKEGEGSGVEDHNSQFGLVMVGLNEKLGNGQFYSCLRHPVPSWVTLCRSIFLCLRKQISKHRKSFLKKECRENSKDEERPGGVHARGCNSNMALISSPN